MTAKPLVTVVIAAYNAGDFIDASVESALTQSGVPLEVIVVNDGSTDDTSRRLAAWSDRRLRVIEKPNGGYASALNAGILASQGVYVGILDADDIWLPGKLAKHIQIHEQDPGLDVTFSWVRVIDERGQSIRRPCPRWRGTVSFSQLLGDYMLRTCSSVVMRREAAERAGPLDSTLIRCIDVEFFLRVSLLRDNNFRAVPEVLTLYRRHRVQRTRDWRLMQHGWKQVLESIRPRAPQQTASVEGLAHSNLLRYLSGLAYEDGNFRDAIRLVGRSIARSPMRFLCDRRNWMIGAAALAGLSLPKPALLALERAAGFDRPIAPGASPSKA